MGVLISLVAANSAKEIAIRKVQRRFHTTPLTAPVVRTNVVDRLRLGHRSTAGSSGSSAVGLRLMPIIRR